MPVSSRPFAPGELIVRFSPEGVRRQATAESELPALLAEVGAQVVSPVFTEPQPVAGKTLSAAQASTLTDISRVYLVRIPSDRDVPATAQQLAASRYVEYAEPNYLVTTTIITPTDPYYNSAGSWGQSYADLWGLLKIQTGAAWETTTGDASVVVGWWIPAWTRPIRISTATFGPTWTRLRATALMMMATAILTMWPAGIT